MGTFKTLLETGTDMLRSFNGTEPQVADSAYVDETAAVVIGDVVIEDEASVWPNTTLRGDHGTIVVGEGANVQDNAVLHETAELEPYSTVGHSAIVHDATVAERALVRMNAVVLDGAHVGEGRSSPPAASSRRTPKSRRRRWSPVRPRNRKPRSTIRDSRRLPTDTSNSRKNTRKRPTVSTNGPPGHRKRVTANRTIVAGPGVHRRSVTVDYYSMAASPSAFDPETTSRTSSTPARRTTAPDRIPRASEVVRVPVEYQQASLSAGLEQAVLEVRDLGTVNRRHPEDLGGRQVGELCEELHLAEHRWRVEHHVVRPECERRPLVEVLVRGQSHVSDEVRARADDDRNLAVRDPVQMDRLRGGPCGPKSPDRGPAPG